MPVIRLPPDQLGPGQLDLFRRTVVIQPPGWPPGPALAGLEHVEELLLDEQTVQVLYLRRPAARQFRLTLRSRDQARCTIPGGAALLAARDFVQRSRDWLARKMGQMPAQGSGLPPLTVGAGYWIHGTPVPIVPEPACAGVRLGDWVVPDLPPGSDLRPALETALRARAARELRQRTAELAARLGLGEPRVSIRQQRSRWGSCSRRGTVSLNWRLIQLPRSVSDYVVVHELLHLSHPGHTPRFWAEVRRACPEWAAAETWLRQHGARFLPEGGTRSPSPAGQTRQGGA